MREAGFNWCHEKTSLDILEFLIVENSLLPVFEQHGLTEIDITFIKVNLYQLFPLGLTT